MAPIRIGIVGLSTVSGSTSWAATAHLPYLRSSPKYEIVALCNSSIERAHASIEKYGLEGVKVYGSPQELDKDPNVDLAVCVVGVERHHEILKPLVEAGKNVFTELPLAASIDQMREPRHVGSEAEDLYHDRDAGQVNPVANLIKSLILDGKLGKVA